VTKSTLLSCIHTCWTAYRRLKKKKKEKKRNIHIMYCRMHRKLKILCWILTEPSRLQIVILYVVTVKCCEMTVCMWKCMLMFVLWTHKERWKKKFMLRDHKNINAIVFALEMNLRTQCMYTLVRNWLFDSWVMDKICSTKLWRL
jgi:hypothetical protein